jgi:hypothetical protein
MIHERANALLRWTGLDEKLANAVLDGIYKLLAETLVIPTIRCAPRSRRGWKRWRATFSNPGMQAESGAA